MFNAGFGRARLDCVVLPGGLVSDKKTSNAAAGMQIGWIDIASPDLRAVHQEWIRLRGSRILPTLDDFENFARSAGAMAARDRSASVLVPSNDTPVFRQIGSAVARLVGGCTPGDRISAMRSMVDRVNIAQPFQKVVSTRQPICRRQQPNAKGENAHELLMLPFSDGGFKVRLIHAVYDLKGVDWKRFF